MYWKLFSFYRVSCMKCGAYSFTCDCNILYLQELCLMWCDMSSILKELKLKYYELMIELCSHDSEYLAICKHYQAVFNTPQVQRQESLWCEVSLKLVFLLFIAIHWARIFWGLKLFFSCFNRANFSKHC